MDPIARSRCFHGSRDRRRGRSVSAVALAIASATALASLVGCDLGVNDFGGSKVVMTIATLKPTDTANGHHLELWARTGDTSVQRLLYTDSDQGHAQVTGGSFHAAYAIVQAVDFKDPCAINLPSDDPKAPPAGTLVWKPEGQPGIVGDPLSCPGAPDDASCRMQQATAVQNRMHQLTDLQPVPPGPLLAFVPWDDFAANVPKIPDGTPAKDRYEMCRKYWLSSPDAYSGNPRHLTAPIHGTFLGAIDFNSNKPSQIAGGILIDNVPYGLSNLREMWLTDTTAPVDKLDPNEVDCAARPATCRGAVYLDGLVAPFARDLLHIDLTSPNHTASGAISVYTHLDQDPVQF